MSARPARPSPAATSPRPPPLSPWLGKKLDKAVSKGVLHKNAAANKKSALAKQAASLKG
ncbi:hypothetical protein GCM10020000_55170 [Streptomyces olivoverticillatus]